MIDMLIAAVRRRGAALRRLPTAARIARILWIAWAVIVWNVTFDRVIVVAGRSYINAASLAAENAPPGSEPRFLKIDDWMRPAVRRGVWIASAAGGTILVTGLVAVRVASRPSTSLRAGPSTSLRAGRTTPLSDR